jgi:murein DD-endopeptidase MepM/ murein hydrolase activator NlpD
VTDIRALRLGRGLTLIDLAQLTDIPARRLAELEYGMQRLDLESRSRLAQVFDIAPELLHAGTRRQASSDPVARWMKRCAYMLIAVMIGLLFPVIPILNVQPDASAAPHSTTSDRPTATSVSTAAQTRALMSATVLPHPSPPAISTPTAQPLPSPTPQFTLAADGPHGCPLSTPTGRVVITQGYNEGTHTPTNVWGAVDLAIDGDGDGNAEPEITQGIAISATNGGVAHVYLGSWPGGNYVRIVDEQAGWSTAYAHLDSVAVTDGQPIGAGALVGTVGSTGMATGPHLHYEVWHGGVNVDPTGLIECH